jgi:hypothetical protein
MFDQKLIVALLKLSFHQILLWFNVLMINWIIIEWLNQCFKCYFCLADDSFLRCFN